MTKKDTKIKYNLKSELFKNYLDKKETNKKETFVNIQQNTPESIYSPYFERYPLWPYETDSDFKNTPYEQNPNADMMPSYTPPYNQPAKKPPNGGTLYFAPNNPMYNAPYFAPDNTVYNQPPCDCNMPYNNPPYSSQPIYSDLPVYEDPIIRNPYVPFGRERISSGYSQTSRGYDRELMYYLYRDINKILHPVVVTVLDEYEYDGSPIYEKYIDHETISQLVDRVLNQAGEINDNIEEIMLDDQNNSYSESEYMPEMNSINLLKAAIESILLNEIFEVRRPNYRKIRNKYNYNNGVYGGINYTNYRSF